MNRDSDFSLSELVRLGEHHLARPSVHPSISSRRLVAVFDESGASSTPGQGNADDFSLAGLVFSGRRAWSDLVSLDAKLQQITGRLDYKYRQVRQSTEARRLVIECLDHQSSLIRVFGYYAAGRAFLSQAERELEAVTAFGGDVLAEQAKLARIAADPRKEGLKDAVATSIPAMSAYAESARKRISVYFDRRTDLNAIHDEVDSSMTVWAQMPIWGRSYTYMDWGGECPPELEPAARISDVFAGDIRATFASKGYAVWNLINQDGYVQRHEEVIAAQNSMWAGPIPAPHIGTVSNDLWDTDWKTGNTDTSMFAGYCPYMLASAVSLYSPCGRGCLLKRLKGEFNVYQVMD